MPLRPETPSFSTKLCDLQTFRRGGGEGRWGRTGGGRRIGEKEGGKAICKNKAQKKLVGIRPNGFYLKKGLREIENKKWDKSIKLFDKEIKYNNNQEAFAYRGYSKFKLEDYLGSIKDLGDALKIDKSDIYSLSLRSRANFALENYDEVILDLNKLNLKLLHHSFQVQN